MKVRELLRLRRAWGGLRSFHSTRQVGFINSIWEENMEHPKDVDVLARMPDWTSHSDKEYGGKSECHLSFPRKDSEDALAPFLTFEGTLRVNKHEEEEGEWKEGESDKDQVLGSFCAVKAAYIKDVLDLAGYDGFEVILESSVTRTYALNMTCLTVFEDDLFQISFELEAGRRSKLHIPFSYFRVTANGRDREVQREADSLQIESVGFMTHARPSRADNGGVGTAFTSSAPIPFTLNVHSITAMHRLDYHQVQRLQLTWGAPPSNADSGTSEMH